MERGPTGRVTREERVFFRSERTGPPDGGRPLRPPGCTGPILSRPFVCRRNCIAKTQTQNCVACGPFPFKATPHIWLQPFPLWRILSRTSYRAGPRYAPSIPLVAHGFTTTQPPLARRLARFARVRFAQRFAPHFAEPPLRGLQLCPSLLGDVLGSARVLVPSIFSFSLRGPVGGVFDGISACFRSTPRPARTLN
jgi:hypothetical protein